MKKIITILAVAAVSASTAFAQGYFNGNTIGGGVNVKIFETDGTTPLSGSSYDAQYYIGAVGSTANQLVPVGNVVNFSTGGGAGYILPGNIQTSFAVGANVALQLRAWRASDGNNWATASTTPFAHAQMGNVFEVDGLQSSTGLPPTVAGLQTFNLAVVPGPEPATVALGLMGAGALFIRRRKA